MSTITYKNAKNIVKTDKWTENVPIKNVLKNGDDMNEYKVEGLGLTRDEQELMTLADEMASSMAGLNAQTYDTFVLAREKFRLKVKQMCDKQKASEERLAKLKHTVASI